MCCEAETGSGCKLQGQTLTFTRSHSHPHRTWALSSAPTCAQCEIVECTTQHTHTLTHSHSNPFILFLLSFIHRTWAPSSAPTCALRSSSAPHSQHTHAVIHSFYSCFHPQNLGTIKCSNLCTEIVEYTSPEETAVCNLASIALPRYVREKDVDPAREPKKLVGSMDAENR